jgi:signal transduction histidine kinase
MYFRNTIALFFLLISIALSAQTKKIDQLKTKVDAATTNDEKLAAIVAYCEDYSNIAQDSLEKYAYVALDLAASSNNERLKSLARLTLAQDYMQWGWTDSVHVVVENELPKNPVTDDAKRDIYFRLKKLKAIAFASEGRMKESLEVLYPAELEAEKYKDSLLVSGLSNMIGSIASARNELNEARKWNDKALVYAEGIHSKYLGSVYISRAQLLYNEDKTDSALYFLEKGIDYCKEIEMYDRLASAYRFQSAVYIDLNDLNKAEIALKNMQAARSNIHNNPDAIIDDNLQIADFYATTGQLKKAIVFCWSKLDSGDYHHKNPGDPVKAFNNDPAARLPFYLALSRYLKEDKDFGEYQNVLEEIIVLKDTLYEINKAEAIAELQTKYDVEQKENTIISQQLKLTRRNYLLYGSLIFIVLASMITWLWLRNERIKQKTKMEQAIEEEKTQAAQSILDAEEKERKRIAADLHDNIGAYATAISADVESITDKGFAGSEEQLQNLQLHSREIIYSLRDTIWVLNKENITITGISDRIKNYINKLKPSYEQINIEVEENISDDVHIGSQKALNIFRIVQEAVHNALKHSNANNVIIQIESEKLISIAIKDDGKGISEIKNFPGNGLRNMEARSADAGIKYTIESSAGGTSILLETTTNWV